MAFQPSFFCWFLGKYGSMMPTSDEPWKGEAVKPLRYLVLNHPIWFGFFATLTTVKSTLWWQNHYNGGALYFNPYGNVHVHHFAYGIVFILLAGGAMFKLDGWFMEHVSTFLRLSKEGAKLILSVIYGCGWFLITDEFSMWVKLREDNPDELRYIVWVFVFFVFIVDMVMLLYRSRYKFQGKTLL